MEQNDQLKPFVKKRKNSRYKEQIFDLIQDSEHGLTSSQIASQLSIAWRTVNKYLVELLRERQIISHNLGVYTVYLTQKIGEQSIYPVLYYAAIKVGGYVMRGEDVKLDRIPQILQETWEELGGQVIVPHENEIPVINGPPTPEVFEHLLDVIKKILCEFGYFGKYPRVKIIPPLGSLTPLTRRIRLTDPGFIAAGTWIHYSMLAGLLQEKLIQKTGYKMMFRVAREIRSGDEEVEFELGFVDHYVVDFSVAEQKDKEKNPRDYLAVIEKFLSTFFRRNYRDYKIGETWHFEITTLDNYQVEDFFVSRARSIRKNSEILKKYKIQPTRKGLPYEEWPTDPYLVIDWVTNLGYYFDAFVDAIRTNFGQGGYCLHFETIQNGVRMNFLEKEDFELFFTNFVDDRAMREHYRFLGITSEDYFRERRESILKIAQEVIKERRDRRMQKQRKVKSPPNT